MYWYYDDRSIQFNLNGQKSGLNKAFYGHRSSLVFLKYRLDRQLTRAAQQLNMLPTADTKSHFWHPKADRIAHFDSPRVDK